MRIKDPVIETLAILLFTQDRGGNTPWLYLDDEDREIYRRMARGEDEISDGENDDLEKLRAP